MKISSQNEISCVGVKLYLTFEGQLPRYVEKARMESLTVLARDQILSQVFHRNLDKG